MNQNTNSNASNGVCPTYFKYGIPVTLAVTSALYYGYKWFMAKNVQKPGLNENHLSENDKIPVETQTAPNSPKTTTEVPKEVVPNLANQ